MYDDFVCTANRAVTDAGITYFFQSEDYAEVEKHFSEEDTYIYYRQPTSDILAYGEPVESQYFSIVREIKDYFASSSSWGYIMEMDFQTNFSRNLRRIKLHGMREMSEMC